MASAAHNRAASRAQRSTRKKRSYRELTSDDDFSDISPIQSRTPPVRSSTRVQRRSYKEDDDSSDATQSASDSESDVPPQAPRSNSPEPHSTTPPRRPQRTASSAKRKRLAPLGAAASHRGLVARKKVKLSDITGADDGSAKSVRRSQLAFSQTIPPWQDLEYQILLQIFKYAAYPLYIGASHARSTIQWLLDVSLLSKSFRAAAVSALLHSPPIYPAERAHGLLRLLKHDQDALSTNYRAKIRELNVEARNLLMKKSGVVLQDLVGRFTPLLSVLNIYHNFDLIRPTTWSRPLTSKKNWAYPSYLFDALDDAGIRLTGFSWNGRFPETKQVLKRMPSLHRRPCLRSLQSLSLLNMTTPEKGSEAETEALLTTALSYLPELRELAFENCAILNETVLGRLPHNLRRLSLTTCANVTSHGLGTFLQLHGQALKGLHLRGNQAMDLGYVCCLESDIAHIAVLRHSMTPIPLKDTLLTILVTCPGFELSTTADNRGGPDIHRSFIFSRH
jgi:hypothetical protein